MKTMTITFRTRKLRAEELTLLRKIDEAKMIGRDCVSILFKIPRREPTVLLRRPRKALG